MDPCISTISMQNFSFLRLSAIVAVTAAAALWGCRAAAQGVSVPLVPVDEAVANPRLYATRAALIDALRRMNRIELERWIAADFNGAPGLRDEAVRALSVDDDEAARLGDALIHGGAFTDQAQNEFCGPYWAVRPPDVRQLPAHLTFEGSPWVVVVPHSSLMAEPDPTSRELKRLSLELVEARPNAPADPLRRYVQVSAGTARGFVIRSDVREIDGAMNACFRQRDGVWSLASFK